MLGGNFRKFGTDSKGISGTFCAFALLCAKLGAAARSSPAASAPAMRHLFIEASGPKVEGIYTSGSYGSSFARDRRGRYARAETHGRGAAAHGSPFVHA